ncbi:non-canonical purine NTP pyrophosphatase [Cupriavidus oxalaticus]|uniref:non-canonical purine NTP pyrophosphatase n=1 Tax=Cupriavidus oxalaticus TaxID=96344 RepID=UPI004034BDB0
MLEIRFISGNEYKISEACSILDSENVRVIPLQIKIDELQTADTQRLVKDKALKAYQEIGRPVFVEHTGLYLEQLGGFPGGLTQVFWDSIQAEKFSALFGTTPSNRVTAITHIGFVDGRRFYGFDGKIDGVISSQPKGPRHFQWDCVFVPSGYDKTFAEMGEEKNRISMRRIALDKFSQFLKMNGRV